MALRAHIAIGCLCACVLGLAEITQAEENLLDNADFEQGKTGWQITNWKGKGESGIVKDACHGGAQSLRMRNGQGMSDVMVCIKWKPKILMKRGRTYSLRAWVKLEDITHGVSLRCAFRGAYKKDFGSSSVYGTRDWTEVVCTITPEQDASPNYLGLWLQGGGTAWCDDFSLREEAAAGAKDLADTPEATPLPLAQTGDYLPPLPDDQDMDAYGGSRKIKGKKTGWFHAEKIDGRWWLITPEGNAFFSTGMYCVRYSGITETGSKKRPYKVHCAAKYGNEAAWGAATLERLQHWGVNTLGDWTSASLLKSKKIPYVLGTGIHNVGRNVIKGEYGFFPDVFDPAYREGVEAKIKERLETWWPWAKEDPWLVGYYICDEPAWYGDGGREGALTNGFIALPATSGGKQAWVQFLKTRYKTIAALNAAWGQEYASFESLLALTKVIDHYKYPAREQDKILFMSRIAEEFARIPYEILRKYDAHHLNLGTRPTRFYPSVVKMLAKYSDVYGVSYYGGNAGLTVSGNFEKDVSLIAATDKPIILGVCLAAADSGYPNAKAWGGGLRTQAERGQSYANYLRYVASHPHVVGLHWFQYFDPPMKCYDKLSSNWGIVNQKDEAYVDLVKAMTSANRSVYDYCRLEHAKVSPVLVKRTP